MQVDEARRVLADQPHFAVVQALHGDGDAHRFFKSASSSRIAGVAVEKLERALQLSQSRRENVRADQRAGANHRACGFLRRGPQHQRRIPALRQDRRQTAIAHRGLQHHEHFAPLPAAIGQGATQ